MIKRRVSAVEWAVMVVAVLLALVGVVLTFVQGGRLASMCVASGVFLNMAVLLRVYMTPDR